MNSSLCKGEIHSQLYIQETNTLRPDCISAINVNVRHTSHQYMADGDRHRIGVFAQLRHFAVLAKVPKMIGYDTNNRVTSRVAKHKPNYHSKTSDTANEFLKYH